MKVKRGGSSLSHQAFQTHSASLLPGLLNETLALGLYEHLYLALMHVMRRGIKSSAEKGA